ncbi:MAG TPA: MarR family transcriptional regulator [Azospirillaceae bacterium]|nr:MarR family transcriptional regulator [Azospirillaceae bacterium]
MLKRKGESVLDGMGGGQDGNGMAGRFDQLLRDAHRGYTRALGRRIGQTGITMGQWMFLRALWEEDGLTQRVLSQRVGMMEPTTVTTLHGMEEAGLVRRVKNPHDRRKVNVFLTDKGRELQGRLLEECDSVDRQASAGIDMAALQTTLRTLGRIAANLTDRDPLPDPAG